MVEAVGARRGSGVTQSGLVRRRLGDSLSRVRDHRLTLITAPAGSGKTTLLRQLADGWPATTCWYQASPADADPTTFLESLARAVHPDQPGRGSWPSVTDACAELARTGAGTGTALLVLDDIQVLDGTTTEHVLGELVSGLPPSAVIAAATRRPLGLDLSRLRVAGELNEIGQEELRFRSWEVDHLFRDVYGVALGPPELQELTQRTHGWAAGLRLFHIATRDMAPADRRRVLSSRSDWSMLVRDYLARNVLDDLPAALQDFLVRTSVLDRLTGPLCDALLDRRDSEAVLAELRHRQAFVEQVEPGVYRYHEMLAALLRSRLADADGFEVARRLQRRAGELLESAGAVVDAMGAFARAEAWDAIESLLGAGGARATAHPESWLNELPAAMVAGDPWLRLARARQHVSTGELDQAVAAYADAERAARDSEAAELCRRERVAVQVWLDPDWAGPLGWSGILRYATQRNPLAAKREADHLPGPTGRLVAGLAALLAGHVEEGVAALADAAQSSGSVPVGAAARLALAVGAVTAGDDRGLEPAAAAAEETGVPWMTVGALATLSVAGAGEAAADGFQLAQSRDRAGDKWGAAVACLLGGIGALRRSIESDSAGSHDGADRSPPLDSAGSAASLLQEAVARFHVLGAEVLEAWARATLAVLRSRERHPDAWSTAAAAEEVARRAVVPGAHALAHAALAACGGPRAAAHQAEAATLARSCGEAIAALVTGLVGLGRNDLDLGEVAPGGALIGRHAEVGRLLARFDAAVAGSAEFALLVGEAGVGKTRVAGQVAAAARERGARAVRVLATRDPVAFSTIGRLVGSLIDRADPADLHDALGLLADEVLALAGVRETADSGGASTTRVVEGVTRLVSWLSRRRPLVVVVDDAHLADPESIEVLQRLHGAARSARVLMLLALRDEEAPPATLASASDPTVTVVRLAGLRGHDLVRLAGDILGGEPPLDVVDAVGQVSGGNPRFVLEALRSASIDVELSGASIVVPAGVKRLVEQRLGRLPPDVAADLQVAAALGEAIELDLLADALDRPPAELRAGLDRATDACLLAVQGQAGWRFPTPAVRQVLAESAPSARVAEAHSKAAGALERRRDRARPGRAAVIARHLLAAGDVDPARLGTWLVAAVHEAIAGGTPAQAVALCDHGLTTVADRATRGRLLELLGEAHRYVDGPAAAQAVYLGATKEARDAADGEWLGRLALAYGRTVGEGFPDATTTALLEESMSLLPKDAGAVRPAVTARLALALPAGPTTEARRRELLEAAIAATPPGSDHRANAIVLLSRQALDWGPDRYPARLAMLADAGRAAERAGDHELVLVATEARRALMLELGAGADADQELAAYARYASAHRVPGAAWTHAVMLCSRALLEGRFVEAERLAGGAIASSPGLGDWGRAREAFILQALVRAREVGRLAAHEAAIRRHAERYPETGLWRAALALVRSEQGRAADARTELDRFLLDDLAALPRDSHWLPTVVLLGELALRLERTDAAEQLYHQLHPWARFAAAAGRGAAVFGSVGRVIGELAALLGWRDEAAEHFEVGLRCETRLGSGPLVVRTKLGFARLLAGGSSAEQAKAAQLVAESVEGARGYGMPGVITAAEAMSLPAQAAPTARPAPAPPPPPAPPRTALAAPALKPLPDALTRLPPPPPASVVGLRSPAQKVEGLRLTCFGGYRLELAGDLIDIGSLKPRVRSLLHLLSISAGQATAAEQLIDQLWPEADLAAGRRSLQVAVSSLRSLLEPGVRRGGWERLVRDGDSYSLRLEDDDVSDIREFERAVAVARQHRRSGREEDALAAHQAALALYAGELLPEAGLAEWIIEPREQRRQDAVETAVAIAELRWERGQPGFAIAACRAGLRIDRYRDQLWRLMLEGYEAVGDHLEAVRARQAYDEVLAELGVPRT